MAFYSHSLGFSLDRVQLEFTLCLGSVGLGGGLSGGLDDGLGVGLYGDHDVGLDVGLDVDLDVGLIDSREGGLKGLSKP